MNALGDPSGLLSVRCQEVGHFLRWALNAELGGQSLRWRERSDIQASRRVVGSNVFSEDWWALVVYSCFMSEIGASAVAWSFREPLNASQAQQVLASLQLPRGAVKYHRVQPAHSGAKAALIGACRQWPAFREILLGPGSFHDRYMALGALGAHQWGRTTRYDLVLRAGALRIGGHFYEPDRAYLLESTGPKKGFTEIFGLPVTRENAAACEELLRTWKSAWVEVADQAGIEWVGGPYAPGDFENALCIYQDKKHR